MEEFYLTIHEYLMIINSISITNTYVFALFHTIIIYIYYRLMILFFSPMHYTIWDI